MWKLYLSLTHSIQSVVEKTLKICSFSELYYWNNTQLQVKLLQLQIVDEKAGYEFALDSVLNRVLKVTLHAYLIVHYARISCLLNSYCKQIGAVYHQSS